MKNYVLIFLILGIWSCTDKKTVIKSENPGEISKADLLTSIGFDTEMHDFGQVKSGEILAYTFVFTNEGENDLIIKSAEADCGCLQINIPEKPVAPGAKGMIEVEFNSAGMIGKQLKTVEIKLNSKEPKHLIIFAEVENEQIEFKN